MFRRQQTGWIGIDVGTATVKVAQLARSGNQLHVIAQAIVPRSTPTSSNESESESESLWSASGEIGAAVSLASDLRGRRAAVTMPMGLCDIHHVDNLYAEADDFESIVRQAVESTTQTSAEHLKFDIWPAEARDNSSEPVRWNVLAVAQAWSDRMYWDVVENNFSCQRIDGLPHSLTRAVNLGLTTPLTSPIATLDWGYSQATFCIVHDGRPVYARVLKDCGLHRMIHSLASGLDILSEEAFGLLQQHGLRGLSSRNNDELDEIVAELITESITYLEQELFRTLSYVDGLRRAIKPQHIYLFGGGGLIQGVAPYLTRQLKIETQVWELDNSPNAHGKRTVDNQCLFGQALALSALAWEES